jgi:formamidopyrimidine-DNA glycosylase
MPEGPEVRITADGLSAHMTGAYIQGIYVNSASRYYNKPISNHDNLQYPLYVQSVTTKGKKILINCVDAYQKPVIMVSALAMEGSWKLNSGKHAGIEIHLQDDNGNSKTVYFHDTRHFGTFHICFVQEELNFVLKDVGPDLLSEDISYEQYHSVISNSKLSRKEICWFLMEQKFFSGVGNYILAEVLYECGILPTRLLGNLSDQDKYNLWYHSRRILQESYQCGGLTIATYFNMAGDRGIYETKVYGKKYDPNGYPVYTGSFSNKRTSHYVPEIQI